MIYLGVEYGCKYTLERPNGARVVFNDPTDPDYVGALSPESSGLDSPEMREDSAERVEADGAIFGDFYAGKRPVILQGEINATDPVDRNKKVAKLRAATNAKRDYATLSWEPKGAGVKVYVNLRRNSLRVTKGFLKEFQASMVASDSRILSYTLQSASNKGVIEGSQEKFPTEALGAAENGFPEPMTNVSNIKANDASYAVWPATTRPNLGEFSGYALGRKYGFTVPTKAIITGVEMKVGDFQTTAGKISPRAALISRETKLAGNALQGYADSSYYARYLSGGSFFSAIPTSQRAAVVGSSTDLWNYSQYLTAPIVNAENFGGGVAYTGLVAPLTNAEPVKLNYVALKVYYVEGPSVTVINEGDVNAPAILTVTGPYKNFYIRNETNGEVLYYNGELAAGMTLTFNTEALTVLETGTGITTPVNRFNNISFPNDWIQVAPGSNLIQVGGTGGSANTELKVEWRHAWE